MLLVLIKISFLNFFKTQLINIMLENPPIQEVILEEQIIPPQKPILFMRSIRERRSAISDDYIVFLRELEVNIRVMEDDLINFCQAMESLNFQKWIDTMNEEMKFMEDNNIWDFVPLLKGAKPISCK